MGGRGKEPFLKRFFPLPPGTHLFYKNMLSEFRALNWRNCERVRLQFERKNLLIGPNGSGKSNLLEAIGFLGVLRSFRTMRIGELIREDCAGFLLRGVWQEPKRSPLELEVGMSRSGERRLLVNRQNENSGRNFIQYFYPVVFAPEDMELVTGAPAVRRRFFDMLSSQLDDGYINVLHDYHKALKLRNVLLKNPRRCDVAQLEVYEGLLAFAGADLNQRRRNCIEHFNCILQDLTGRSSKLTMEYMPQSGESPEENLEQFARNRKREMEKRTTLCGCHLDDFRLCSHGKAMKGFASNGQNRMAALNCKSASARMIMRKRGAEHLLVLVDDVTGELDKFHREEFYELIAPAGQQFFTFTAHPGEEFFADAQTVKLPLELA